MRSSCSLSSSSNPSLRSSPKSDPNSSKSCYNLRSRVRWRWEKLFFVSDRITVGAMVAPELIFNLQESRFEPFFSLRERHFRCPRGALLSSGAEIPVGAQFLLRGTCRGPQSSDYSRELLANLRPRATVRARARDNTVALGI